VEMGVVEQGSVGGLGGGRRSGGNCHERGRESDSGIPMSVMITHCGSSLSTLPQKNTENDEASVQPSWPPV